MASSCWRADARASRRLDTLAQAISRTRPTTINSIAKNATKGTMLRCSSRAKPATGTRATLLAQEASGLHPGG